MLKNFLKDLSEEKFSDGVINQYHDKDVLNNLKLHFDWLLRNNPKVLVVGEAPGYKGCRITGIPFTSGKQIRDSQHKLFLDIGNKIELKETIPERTATIVWNFFGKDRPVPIFWNSFPFHPYKINNPDSNRPPSSREIEIGRGYLEKMVDLFKPVKFYALGRSGERALKAIFPTEDIMYIRHPSFGGQKDFKDGMEQVLKELS